MATFENKKWKSLQFCTQNWIENVRGGIGSIHVPVIGLKNRRNCHLIGGIIVEKQKIVLLYINSSENVFSYSIVIGCSKFKYPWCVVLWDT